jgi:predicted anti-sigma-YlaC factor YlaD
MLCHIYRWIIACSIDKDSKLGPRVQHHLDACSACRQYYHRQQDVSNALKQQVPQLPLPTNQLLPDRIMASVSPHSPGAEKRRVFRLTTHRAVAACLLIVLGLAMTMMRMNAPDSSPLSPKHPALTTMTTLQQQLVPDQLMSAYVFLVQDSLEAELNKLSTDAQKAARFLVQCTPSHGGTGTGMSSD